MPRVFQGSIVKNETKFNLTCILDSDIKINIYKPNDFHSLGFANLLMQKSGNLSRELNSNQDLLSSYVSYIEKEETTKSFKRRTFTYGNMDLTYLVLEHTAHSYMEQEETSDSAISTIEGIMQTITYEKQTNAYSIFQKDTYLNGIKKEMYIQVKEREGTQIEIHLEDIGSGKVTLTKDVKYQESLFNIGMIRENAIHTQVRSLQHLRTIKDLSWIENLIKNNNFRIVETEDDLKDLVKEIQLDFMRTGERKIYYDTEGTGLNIMNLPPDHPAKDMMAAHVIGWVRDRREDGYPLDVVSVTIPVGMKYTKNVDEIKAKEILRPLLTNPNIGVVSHNCDYELQINARYSEIEGELSYNEYYKWKQQLEDDIDLVDIPAYKSQIEDLNKEIQEIENDDSLLMLIKASKIEALNKQIKELESKINYKNEIERVRNLPKEQKPYLSKVKGEDIYKINILYDTLVLSRMVNNGAYDARGVPFLRHNLEFLTKNYLNLDQLSLDDIYGNASSSKYKIYDFSLLPREFMLYYACPDGWTLPFVEWHLERQAYNHMINLGYDSDKAYVTNLELLNLYYHVDVPFAVHQALYANYKGIGIDKEQLDMERQEQEQIRDALLNFLEETTGEDISWTSTKQVASLIFYKYKYPIKFRTEKDNLPSYNKATRKLHIAQTKNEYEPEYARCVPIKEMEEDLVVNGKVILDKDVVNNLMCPLSYVYQEFMNRHKDLTSFTKMIYERTFNVNGEWIYFPTYISTSTDTGRASGGIMIMKSEKKSIFKARNNHVLGGGDLDQAELRLIATMAGDLQEIQRFKNPRYDPHTQTASDVNGVPMEKVTGTMRNAAKVINFGIAYGIGAKAATAQIYPKVVPIPDNLVAKTTMMIKEYNRTYIERSTWLDNLKKSTIEYGYSKTPYGRYKFFPEVQDENIEPWELGRIGRQGGNVPIQGCCADFIKQRIVRVFNEIEKAGITRYFTQPIFVHDEFFCEINKDVFQYAENKVYTTEMVKKEQQFNIMWFYSLLYEEFTEIPLNIEGLEDEAPMTMGIGIGCTWEEAKSDLYGCPQELQRELIQKYRNNNISDELFKELCENPIDTLLHQIRTWWATQIKNELEKHDVNISCLPENVSDYVDDLFLKRNLKDIFPISPSELEDFGIKDDNFFLGQCIKALNYLEGKPIEIKEVLVQDKEEGVYDIVYTEQDTMLGEIIDLQSYRQVKEYYKYVEGKEIIKYDKEDIEAAYASVFKESSLMMYNRYMAFEETKVFEFNVRYLAKQYIIKLEELIRKYDGLGLYDVVIVRREDGNIFGDTIPTTYKIPVTTELLMKIKTLYLENENYLIELEKSMVK